MADNQSIAQKEIESECQVQKKRYSDQRLADSKRSSINSQTVDISSYQKQGSLKIRQNQASRSNKRNKRQWSSSLKECDSETVNEMKQEFKKNLDMQEMLDNKLQNNPYSLSKIQKKIQQFYDNNKQEIILKIGNSENLIDELKSKQAVLQMRKAEIKKQKAEIKNQEAELLKQLKKEENSQRFLYIQLTENSIEAQNLQALLTSKNSTI
eukprot:403346247